MNRVISNCSSLSCSNTSTETTLVQHRKKYEQNTYYRNRTTPAIVLANNSSTLQGISFDGPVNVSVVSELLKDSNMFTEKDVVVEGTLVRQLNKDTYIFTDGSAEIQVELDDDIRFTQTINSNTRLRLFGEFEGGNTPEIEVDSLTQL